MPGMLVLRNDGFKTSANPIVTVTGIGSLLMAPFGSRLQHRRHHGSHLHRQGIPRRSVETLDRRASAGVFYILVGIFGVTLAALFMAFPATFITTLAVWHYLAPLAAALPGAPWPTPERAKPR